MAEDYGNEELGDDEEEGEYEPPSQVSSESFPAASDSNMISEEFQIGEQNSTLVPIAQEAAEEAIGASKLGRGMLLCTSPLVLTGFASIVRMSKSAFLGGAGGAVDSVSSPLPAASSSDSQANQETTKTAKDNITTAPTMTKMIQIVMLIR